MIGHVGHVGGDESVPRHGFERGQHSGIGDSPVDNLLLHKTAPLGEAILGRWRSGVLLSTFHLPVTGAVGNRHPSSTVEGDSANRHRGLVTSLVELESRGGEIGDGGAAATQLIVVAPGGEEGMEPEVLDVGH